MEYIRVIVNKIPDQCIACVISNLHICGKETIEHPTSGSAVKVWKPDYRCLLREGKQ